MSRVLHCLSLGLWAALLLIAHPAAAQVDYLDESRTFADEPVSTTDAFTFVVPEGGDYPHVDLTIELTQGSAELRIYDTVGVQILTLSGASLSVSRPVPDAWTPGPYMVQIETTDAVGRWHVRIFSGSAPPKVSLVTKLAPGMTSAALMLIVALAAVSWWRRRFGGEWRWLAIGAGLWAGAVVVKGILAVLPMALEKADVGSKLREAIPGWVELTIGTIYGGVMTGVTEIGVVFLAALLWRRMTETAARGVGIGVGAGAFEAALLALTQGVAIIVIVAMSIKGTGVESMSWSIVAVPAVERAIVIPCHIASRALVLMAVASGRWSLFWYGFMLLSAIDAIGTLLHLTGQVGTMSPWLMEAFLLPFGLISIPIIGWCIRSWPKSEF